MHLKGADIREAFPGFSLQTSVLKLLLESLEYNGSKVAQIEGATGKTYTFADILQQSKSISAGLNRAGIAPGDFVVICCSKSSLAYSAQLGVMFAGAIPVMIEVSYAAEIPTHTKGYVIKAIFCDKIHLQSVTKSLSQMNLKPTLIAATDFDNTTMNNLLLPSDEFSLFEVKDNRKHVILVLYTSGSTADPKGVKVSDLGLQRLGYSFDDGSIESYLLTSPLAWIGSTIALVSSILKGYTLILSETKDPASHFKLIENYRVNGWTVFGGTINLYAKEPSLANANLSSLTLINVGGAVVRKRVLETFVSEVMKRRIGVQVLYGMTEVGIISTWRNRDLLDLSKADSSGYLAPGVEVKITDEHGRLLESGNIGEIRVQSLSIMVGYSCRPDLECIDSDGFFRTGDVGYFDNDGFLYVIGRGTDLITQGGSKVSVTEVEDLLKSHPDVLDAAVTAKPHLSDTYNLTAFVVVKPNSRVQEKDISVFVAEAGGTMELKGVHIVEELPRTDSGKVHKGLLHNMADKLHTLSH